MPCRIQATQRKTVFFPASTSDREVTSKSNDCFRSISLRIEPSDGDTNFSSYVEIGKTIVICTVTGPKELFNDLTEGTLNVTMHGAENVRGARHTVQASLESIVCLKRLARTEVNVEISIIADDGGLVAASLLAAGLALASANIEQFDIVLACQLMIKDGDNRFVVDPDFAEVKAAGPTSTLVTIGIAPSLGQVVCLDVCGAPISQNYLDRSIRFGYDRCLQLYPAIAKCLKKYLRSSCDDFE